MSGNENDAENERPSEAEHDEQDGEESGQLDSVALFTTAGRMLKMLRRCEAGESADLVFAEVWANAEHVE